MPEEHTCPECGEAIPDDAPHGLCLGCLAAVAAGAWERTDSGSDDKAPAGWVAPSPKALAPFFPGLEILEVLGQGGMGVVYKARQKDLDRPVALKILSTTLAEDAAFAERFRREARSLGRLNHPNIVGVYDFGEAQGLYFLVMEYVEGWTLRRILRERRLLEPHEVLSLIPQICDALQYAHELGIIHRDVKPENILVDPAGRAKLADFGLSKLMRPSPEDASLTGSRQAMGTPNYMSPEQLEHPEEVDHRADIYSLGVIFYEMLTGERPLGRFDPPSQKVQTEVPLDEVILKALAKEPAQRYQSAREIKQRIRRLRGPKPPRKAETKGTALGNAIKAGASAVKKSLGPGAYAPSGKRLVCPHCGGDAFKSSAVLLLGAHQLICAKCNNIQWFTRKPGRIADS